MIDIFPFKTIERKDNLIAATLNLLHLLNVKVTVPAVKDALLSNPAYPSLLSVSESLKQWNIESEAYSLNAGQLGQLPVPFIAHLNINSGTFVTVTRVKDNEIVYLKDNGQPLTVTSQVFINQWSGKVLLAEASAESGEPGYEKRQQRYTLNRLKLPALAALFLLTGGMAFVQSAGYYRGTSLLLFAGLWVTSVIGLFISGLLLWYDYDENNSFIKKLCGVSAKTNCNAVLTSKAAKFLGFSWAEWGFFYFMGQFIYMCSSGYSAQVLYPIVLINTLAVPYIAFSVSYQAFVVKQWCVLCLTVQAVLLAAFVIIIQTHALAPALSIDLQLLNYKLLLFAYLLPVLVWLLIKPFIHGAKQDEEIKYKFRRFKNNPEVFNSLLQTQLAASNSMHNLGIILGNRDAENTLTKICNPYCGPCAQSYPQLEDLIKKGMGKWNVQIIFFSGSDESDYRTLPVAHFFAIEESSVGKQSVGQALADWYGAKTKDYEAYKNKYPIPVNFEQHKPKLAAMTQWCHQERIEFTPTYYVNGRRLPDSYSITDLSMVF